jgi:hypothetical protein
MISKLRLCMFVDSVESPWPIQVWNECEQDIALEDGLPTWMAMDLNFNRELACLVTLQKRDNGYGVFLHEWKKEGGINDLRTSWRDCHTHTPIPAESAGL